MAARGIYGFEGIDATLDLVPLAARRALDAAGWKLSLAGWRSLPSSTRAAIVQAGVAEPVSTEWASLIVTATPSPARIDVPTEPDATLPPPALARALGAARPLDPSRWAELGALGRFALARYTEKPETLARAYDEIVGPPFSHLDDRGDARMVSVASKSETARRAVASARVQTTAAVVGALSAGSVAKGDVLGAARIAGILAAKRTPELIPLCHPVRTTCVAIDFALEESAVRVSAVAEAVDRTGVEMEAMVAASVAALTLYDMIKSADRWASLEAVRLESKEGGKSGAVTRPAERS